MAKKRERKSRVSRLPTPEQNKQDAQQLTANEQATNIDKLEQATEMMKMELAADANKKTKAGRKKKNDGRIRTTIMLPPKLWQQVKGYAAFSGMTASEYLEAAILDYNEKQGNKSLTE